MGSLFLIFALWAGVPDVWHDWQERDYGHLVISLTLVGLLGAVGGSLLIVAVLG